METAYEVIIEYENGRELIRVGENYTIRSPPTNPSPSAPRLKGDYKVVSIIIDDDHNLYIRLRREDARPEIFIPRQGYLRITKI